MSNHPVPDPESDANEYGTPRTLTRDLARHLPTEGAKFDLDPASGAESEPHAHDRYTREDDGLRKPWHGWVWCNPPWSAKENDGRMKEAWLRRATSEVERESVDGVYVLLPSDTTTGWFREYGTLADYVTFAGRVRYDGADGRNPAFGSKVLVYGDPPDMAPRSLADKGPTYSGPVVEGLQTDLLGVGEGQA